jgi:LuxR family maltose regulon positive regulatory protein
METYALPKIYQGEIAKVIGWFDRLPEATLESAPMLCIGKAWALAVMQRSTRLKEAEPVLQAADHALDLVNADDALRNLVAGHSASIRAYLMRTPEFLWKDPQGLIAVSQEAQQLLPAEDKAIRSVNAMNIGWAHLALADLDAACFAFKDTLEEGLTGGNFYAAIYGPVNLIIISLLLGDLRGALQLCDANIERFNRIVAGQYFPPIGALYILKGSILLEFDHLADAEKVLIEGLDLVRWTGETLTHKAGFTALARLRAIQGNRQAMLEAVNSLEEAWPESALYTQSLQHRLATHHWPDDPDVQQDAHTWLVQSGIKFAQLDVIRRVDPISQSNFEINIRSVHVLACLARRNPGAYSIEDAHIYLNRQQEIATSQGLASWTVEIAIAKSLLCQAEGKRVEALDNLELALSVAVDRGLFRIFVDEGKPLQGLLVKLKPHLRDEELLSYTNRLLEAFNGRVETPKTGDMGEALLSERELEVLHYLAQGITYAEIGQQLFLSLNTVQFHVKNIYSKLLVNKRVQAVEKAREMDLI